MKLTAKIWALFLVAALTVGLSACGGGGSSEESSKEDSQSGSVSESSEDETMNSNYLVYNGKGELIFETENIFAAYIRAGKLGTNGNKTYVMHGDEEIFSWGENSTTKL